MGGVVALDARHRHGLHMTQGVLLHEHLDGLLVGEERGLVDGSEIRGVELDRGTGGLGGGVGGRGGLVLLGRGTVDLEESHFYSSGFVVLVKLRETEVVVE